MNEQLEALLRQIMHPETGQNIVDSGFVDRADMGEDGSVAINGYVGKITTGDAFYVETFSIFPVVGEDIYTWKYDEPAYTFAGNTMTAVKVEGELSSVKKSSKVTVMHKHANAKFNAKHFTAARFVK